MSNDKTLATAKHGGRVQLGDGLQLANEWRHVFAGDGHDMAGANKNTIRRFIQAIDSLSAQPSPVDMVNPISPSPGGQGAPERCAECRHTTFEVHPDGHICVHCKLIVAARQPVYVQGSDELRARTDGERAAYMEGLEEGKKIAARQPVGEPVAWKYQDKAADGVWEDRISERLPCWEHRNPIPLYAVPSAQAKGLGQFRKAVEAWKRDAQNKHRAGEIFPEQKDAIWKEADRLLALIDSQAVGNG